MPHLTVLIGETDDTFLEILGETTQDALGEKYELNVFSAVRSDEFLQNAESHPIDLFLLLLNNMIFPSSDIPGEDRLNQMFRLITHLKKTYGKPIIAFSAIPAYQEQAKSAGADLFFRLPFKLEDLQQGIRDLLSIE